MELVNWSLNAIDRIFSTRSSGSGEPVCPGGTFAAGYTRDAWEEWRVVCLAILSVEDIEDVYIFGTMITGFLLIGLGITLVYREIRKTVTAVQSPAMLPGMIDRLGRAVSTQTVAMDRTMENILEKLSALQRRMDRFGDQNGQIESLPEQLPCENAAVRRSLPSLPPFLHGHLLIVDSVGDLIKGVSTATAVLSE